MNSSDTSPGLLRQPQKTRTPSSTVLALLLLLPILALGTAGCSMFRGQTEVIYSRATRAVEEEQGHLRLAENTVRVNVAGTEKVGTLTPCGGYFLIHRDDLVAFVRAARRLAMSDEAKRLLTEQEVEAATRGSGPR
mgnify:CR=1 FL=1